MGTRRSFLGKVGTALAALAAATGTAAVIKAPRPATSTEHQVWAPDWSSHQTITISRQKYVAFQIVDI